MTPSDIAYTRLCIAVWCAGVTLWQDRMDQWLAAVEGNGR